MRRRRWYLLAVFDMPQKLEQLDEMTPDRVRLAERDIATGRFLDDSAKLLGTLGRKNGHGAIPA